MSKDLTAQVVNMMMWQRGDYTTITLANKFNTPYHKMRTILEDAKAAGLVVKNPEKNTWRYRF